MSDTRISSATAATAPASTGFRLEQQQAFIRWIFWATALVVLVLSLLPGDRVPLPTTGWDKADHFLAYATMAALGCMGWPRRTMLLLSSLLAFGIAIEGLQAMTGYRSAELNDVWAEVLGLGLGAGVAWVGWLVLGRVRAARS